MLFTAAGLALEVWILWPKGRVHCLEVHINLYGAVMFTELVQVWYVFLQMNRLYQLHLENTEMPAKYSVLLQLREMLDIKEADAEKLEQEVLGSSSSFSI
jgi:hypothetical protein